jgi:hypothetical protein
MIYTNYRGEPVQTSFCELDEDATVYCLNDDCAEVQREDGEIVEVVRAAWDPRTIPATRWEPAADSREWCPQCGQPDYRGI